MFFPIATESLRARTPWVTIGLIVINALVWLTTHSVPDRQFEELIALEREITGLEMAIELSYLGDEATEVPFWLRAMGKRTDAQREFWERWDAGEVENADPELVRGLRDLNSQLARLDAQRFDRKWGFWWGNPNLLSLLTSMFLHADIWHLTGNMLFLWLVGVNVECSWGQRLFLLVYFLGGTVSALAQALADFGSTLPGIGASGAVAGIMGAFALRHSTVKIRFYTPLVGVFSAKAGYVLPVWFAQQLHGAFKSEAGEGGVAFWAHVGGFVSGLVVAIAVRRMRVEETVIAPELAREDRAREAAAARLALARVSETGTASERRAALERAAAADPEDLGLRKQRLLARWGAVPEAELAVEGHDLLKRLWSAGDRRGYLEIYRIVDGLGEASRPGPAFALRAASALETTDRQAAAELLHAVLARTPADDPHVPQLLERYAKLLDALGHGELAAAVRARLTPDR